jgi:uncharacterized protein YkwD
MTIKILDFLTFALAGTAVVVAAPAPVNTRDGAKEGDGMPDHTDPNFISHVMDAHWYWRKIHCAQDLTWDSELAAAALESVNKCTEEPHHVCSRPSSSFSLTFSISARRPLRRR